MHIAVLNSQLMSYALFRSRPEAYSIIVIVGVGACHLSGKIFNVYIIF